MTLKNPIEEAFIQAVEDIVASITRQESTLAEQLTKLDQHLKQAKLKGWLRYQVTTLNAISIAHMVYADNNPEHVLAILREALGIAEQTDDLTIKLKIINNIAYQLISTFFDFEGAEKQIDHGWALFEESGGTPSVIALFLLANKSSLCTTRGDFAKAKQFLDRAFALADDVIINEVDRNDYYRMINILRDARIMINMAHKQFDNLLDDIKLNKEIYEKLYKTDINVPYYANMALYRLICEQDPTGYETWISKFNYGDTLASLDLIRYLKHLNYYPQALGVINRVLDTYTAGENLVLDGVIQNLLQEAKDGMQKSTGLPE